MELIASIASYFPKNSKPSSKCVWGSIARQARNGPMFIKGGERHREGKGEELGNHCQRYATRCVFLKAVNKSRAEASYQRFTGRNLAVGTHSMSLLISIIWTTTFITVPACIVVCLQLRSHSCRGAPAPLVSIEGVEIALWSTTLQSCS